MKLAELIEQSDLSSVEIQYGVIYSVDAEEINESDGPPTSQAKLWNLTEDNEESDYGIEGWQHKKWYALLTQDQFDEFVGHVSIYAQNVKTMGSLGAPSPDGICFGISPAISFEDSRDDGICNAYVTPYVIKDLFANKELDVPCDELDWEALRKKMIEKYK
jgi:hypothetical protein